MLHYWPVNLRVARKFTGLHPPPPPPPQKLDLRVARKSTTSPLPGQVWELATHQWTLSGGNEPQYPAPYFLVRVELIQRW